MTKVDTLNTAKDKLLNTIYRITLEYTDTKKDNTEKYSNTEHIPITKPIAELSPDIFQILCSLDDYSDEITIMNVVFKKNSTMPAHKHIDRWEYIYVIEGEIYDNVNGVETKSGSVYKIPPDTPHHITTKNGALTVITFKPRY